MKKFFIITGLLVTANVICAQWKITIIDSNLDTSGGTRYTSIALDVNGCPGISYCSDNYVKYAHWNGTSWDKEVVEATGGRYNSLTYDNSNTPYIAFLNTANRICCAVKSGSLWNTQVVDSCNAWSSPKIVGLAYPAIALGADGYPRIAYQATWTYGVGGFDYGGDTRCARYTGSAWTAGTAWNPPPMGDGSYSGNYIGIATGSDNSIYISFLLMVCAYNSSLSYVKYTGSWQPTMNVDGNCYSGPTSGYYTSVALDGANKPHISCLNQSSYLRHVWPDGSVENVELADNGVPTSIAMDDTSDYPCIAYGRSSGLLGYAEWNGSAWNTGTVDPIANTGNAASLAIRYRIPHISYIDENNSYLKYAIKGDETCGGAGAEENHNFISLPELKITPNPTFSKFHIRVNGNGKEFEVKLFDAGGRLVKVLHNGNERLWESNETLKTPGIYFITLGRKGITEVKKVIVLGQ